MKRTALLIGFGAGYILGSKAGRERYEQIKRWWRSFTGSPPVHAIAERGKDLAEEAGRKSLGAVQRGVSKVGSGVKDRLGNGHAADVPAEGIGI